MNSQIALHRELSDHAIEVGEARDLALIHEPNSNLVIWSRLLPHGLDPLLQHLRTTRESLDMDWSGRELERIADNLRAFVRDPLYQTAIAWLSGDIIALAQRYTELTGVIHPRVRLERVQDGGCVLFHEDHMALRLLCTYAGPGMQWVANESVRREELGLRGRSVREANAAMVPDPRAIRSVPAGHVAVFKGAIHPHREVGALIHRSAPVSGPDEYRIRLCIDDTSGCSC